MRRTLGPMFTSDSDSAASGGSDPASCPRILWRQTRPGFHHPLSKRDVRQFLESIGALAVYGLRSIEFARDGTNPGRAASLAFGRYEAPGRILLFEQPLPPWRLPGKLVKRDAERFERCGALVCRLSEVGATLVDWPADTLRRFMLEEVLLHELGHHVLQYHKGKRLARIARTKDHEAFAALFAERQRSQLADR